MKKFILSIIIYFSFLPLISYCQYINNISINYGVGATKYNKENGMLAGVGISRYLTDNSQVRALILTDGAKPIYGHFYIAANYVYYLTQKSKIRPFINGGGNLLFLSPDSKYKVFKRINYYFYDEYEKEAERKFNNYLGFNAGVGISFSMSKNVNFITEYNFASFSMAEEFGFEDDIRFFHQIIISYLYGF